MRRVLTTCQAHAIPGAGRRRGRARRGSRQEIRLRSGHVTPGREEPRHDVRHPEAISLPGVDQQPPTNFLRREGRIVQEDHAMGKQQIRTGHGRGVLATVGAKPLASQAALAPGRRRERSLRDIRRGGVQQEDVLGQTPVLEVRPGGMQIPGPGMGQAQIMDAQKLVRQFGSRSGRPGRGLSPGRGTRGRRRSTCASTGVRRGEGIGRGRGRGGHRSHQGIGRPEQALGPGGQIPPGGRSLKGLPHIGHHAGGEAIEAAAVDGVGSSLLGALEHRNQQELLAGHLVRREGSVVAQGLGHREGPSGVHPRWRVDRRHDGPQSRALVRGIRRQDRWQAVPVARLRGRVEAALRTGIDQLAQGGIQPMLLQGLLQCWLAEPGGHLALAGRHMLLGQQPADGGEARPDIEQIVALAGKPVEDVFLINGLAIQELGCRGGGRVDQGLGLGRGQPSRRNEKRSVLPEEGPPELRHRQMGLHDLLRGQGQDVGVMLLDLQPVHLRHLGLLGGENPLGARGLGHHGEPRDAARHRVLLVVDIPRGDKLRFVGPYPVVIVPNVDGLVVV
ncbi:hypothetical protein H696_05146 [Fonticula alba]|uniref:Uncharacterized protein n=1 Tax=Fonticula alba TaxID=691883 RepID=A0A058Z253_FONAL|nr:hypothetical protein H696_05146 [Fonticula alba]KCV68221.1 hypothetical protein H696_05146 [Fonticula alba]|eukprot:XP_009497275.1 hypothetical protein H696_05146 [Fonticula alba]